LIDKYGIVQLSTGDMLRAAAAAPTPVGQRTKAIIDRGDLVPDDVVVSIIAERIDRPDARRGFVLDGFPRTVAQAEALERLLAERGLKLDAVIELKVDEGILLGRIEKRIADMKMRGEASRADDNAEVLKGRLNAYRSRTAPLSDYYAGKGMLTQVDGMAPVARVTGAIDRVLGAGRARPAGKASRGRKPASRRKAASGKAKPAKRAKGRKPAGMRGTKARAAKRGQPRRKSRAGRGKSNRRRG
jgi:adenylate kinase